MLLGAIFNIFCKGRFVIKARVDDVSRIVEGGGILYDGVRELGIARLPLAVMDYDSAFHKDQEILWGRLTYATQSASHLVMKMSFFFFGLNLTH